MLTKKNMKDKKVIWTKNNGYEQKERPGLLLYAYTSYCPL
jgi:hypothetical protein